MYLHSILGLVGDMSYLSFVNFCFLQLMIILSVNLEQEVSEAKLKTKSSWLNCALRGDEAVYWVSKDSNICYLMVLSQHEAELVGN